MEKVSERLTAGTRFGSLSYPWIGVILNFLLNVVKEHAADPAQKVFWHTSAATNHLYVQEEWFRAGFSTLVRDLEAGGYLPLGAELRMIPTHSCQLFALRPESLPALEALISCWRESLRHQEGRASRHLAAFERAAAPGAVVEEVFREMEPRFLAELARRLAEFNALDPNHLPIAYLPEVDHPTYNKYGIAQRHLRGQRPLFPEGFLEMTWGEAELLTKTLARIVIDRCELTGRAGLP
jgi:hypothetical protein